MSHARANEPKYLFVPRSRTPTSFVRFIHEDLRFRGGDMAPTGISSLRSDKCHQTRQGIHIPHSGVRSEISRGKAVVKTRHPACSRSEILRKFVCDPDNSNSRHGGAAQAAGAARPRSIDTRPEPPLPLTERSVGDQQRETCKGRKAHNRASHATMARSPLMTHSAASARSRNASRNAAFTSWKARCAGTTKPAPVRGRFSPAQCCKKAGRSTAPLRDGALARSSRS